MPSRALVSIKKTLLSRTSKLVTNMVKSMADLKDGTSEIKSTENLKAGLDELNKKYRDEALRKSLLKKTSTPSETAQGGKGHLHNDFEDPEASNKNIIV